jgi:hypothetical protein
LNDWTGAILLLTAGVVFLFLGAAIVIPRVVY